VRLNILRGWDKPMLSGFGLYLSDVISSKDVTQLKPVIAIEPVELDEKALVSGLNYRYYDRGLQSASLLDSVFAVKLLKAGITNAVNVALAEADIGYSLTLEGFLMIPDDGEYTFQLESADGSLLFLGTRLIINNDEPHERRSKSQAAMLKRGYFQIKILYTSFRHPGFLRLLWQRPQFGMRETAPEYLYMLLN
jgi:hypothetical protein